MCPSRGNIDGDDKVTSLLPYLCPRQNRILPHIRPTFSILSSSVAREPSLDKAHASTQAPPSFAARSLALLKPGVPNSNDASAKEEAKGQVSVSDPHSPQI